MKDSGIEWIGDIPDHWSVYRIKYCSYVKGRIGWQGLRSDEFTEKGPYLITGTDFEDGKVNWKTCYHVSQSRYEQDPYIQVIQHDLLITKDGTIGKLAYIDNLPGQATLNSHLLIIRPEKAKFMARFLYWVFQADYFNTYVNLSQTGTTFFGITQEKIENFVFTAPRIEEQRTISNFLDSKVKLIKEQVHKKRRLINLLIERRNAIISQLVTNGLDNNTPMKDSGIEWISEIPKHWNIGKLRNYVIKIGSGITPRGGGDTYVENGIPLIRSQNVHFDGLHLDDVAYIPPTIHEHMKSSRVQKLDVLMNITGASLGRCTVVPSDLGEANVNQHVCIIRPRSELSSRFLSFYLASSPLQSFIYALQVGASRQGLTYDDIGSLDILIPPIDEQDKVANYLEEISSHLDIIIKKTENQIEKLEEYQCSLIFMVLTGKVDIRQEVVAS